MPNFIKLSIGDIEIWMEADEARRAPEQVSVEAALKRAVVAGEQVATTIRGYSALLVRAFQETTQDVALAKVTAEFGIKVTGEGNVCVVKSAADASVKVTAEWQRPQ
jgi:hypothetical protein